MKKLSLIITWCIFLFLFECVLASEYDFPCDIFSISEEKQEEIYEVITRNRDEKFEVYYKQMSIVKESIIPVYIMDFYTFAETEKVMIYPFVEGYRDSEYDYFAAEGKEPNVFYADLVFEDGTYGGGIQFYIIDDKAYLRSIDPSGYLLSKEGTEPTDDDYANSVNHEKVKENIQRVLKKENINLNDVKSIKYTIISELRSVRYCVDYCDRMLLISPGRIDKNGTLMEPFYFYEDDESFIQKVEDTLQYMKEFKEFREQWIKEHPGEPFTYVGGPGAVISNNDNELTTTQSKEKSKWLIILLLIVSISVIMIMGYIIIKKKKILKTIDQT